MRRANADISPVKLSSNISFSSVGGLSQHISLLSETIVLPLLFPSIFRKYGMNKSKSIFIHFYCYDDFLLILSFFFF
jgi:ATP-dependent 26S proteasome regulatory subunit